MTPGTARDALRRAYPFGMGLVVGVMVAGLVVPFAVGDSEEPATSTFAGGTGASADGSVGADGTVGDDGFGSAEDGALDGSGLTSGGDAATGGTGGSGTGSTGGTGGRRATASAGGSGGSGASGGDAPAPRGGGGPGLSATDRGVTAESIRVGALLLDIGSLGRVGVGVPI